MKRKRRNFKNSPEKRKSLAMSMGINASNKSQLKKISKTKIKKELPQVPLCDLYMRVDKQWVHKGQSCRLCGKLMNHETVIDKHRYICEVLNKKNEDD